MFRVAISFRLSCEGNLFFLKDYTKNSVTATARPNNVSIIDLLFGCIGIKSMVISHTSPNVIQFFCLLHPHYGIMHFPLRSFYVPSYDRPSSRHHSGLIILIFNCYPLHVPGRHRHNVVLCTLTHFKCYC